MDDLTPFAVLVTTIIGGGLTFYKGIIPIVLKWISAKTEVRSQAESNQAKKDQLQLEAEEFLTQFAQDHLKTTLEKYEESNTILEGKVNDLSQEINNIKRERDVTTSRLTETQRELSEVREELAAAQKEIKQLQDNFDRARKEKSALEYELNQAESRVETLQKRNEQLQTKCKELEEKYEATRATLSEREIELAVEKERNKFMDKTLREVNSRLSNIEPK